MAPNGVNDLKQHTFAGGVRVDPDRNTVEVLDSNTITWARLHGALMTIAFALLMPLAVISSRHRWIYSSSGSGTSWFYIHMGLQISSSLLLIAGGCAAGDG